MLQAYFGLPRTVGLDLAAEDIDVAQPLPALAVAEMDSLASPGREDPQATRYLCLTADNRCTPTVLSLWCQCCPIQRTSGHQLV